jgi:hypothetical protein
VVRGSCGTCGSLCRVAPSARCASTRAAHLPRCCRRRAPALHGRKRHTYVTRPGMQCFQASSSSSTMLPTSVYYMHARTHACSSFPFRRPPLKPGKRTQIHPRSAPLAFEVAHRTQEPSGRAQCVRTPRCHLTVRHLRALTVPFSPIGCWYWSVRLVRAG